MTSGLFRRKLSPMDQVFHHRVIPGHLTHTLFSQQIGPAISNIENVRLLSREDYCHHCGSHTTAIFILFGPKTDRLICQDGRLSQMLSGILKQKLSGKLLQIGGGGFHRQRARDVSRPGAPHAITDHRDYHIVLSGL